MFNCSTPTPSEQDEHAPAIEIKSGMYHMQPLRGSCGWIGYTPGMRRTQFAGAHCVCLIPGVNDINPLRGWQCKVLQWRSLLLFLWFLSNYTWRSLLVFPWFLSMGRTKDFLAALRDACDSAGYPGFHPGLCFLTPFQGVHPLGGGEIKHYDTGLCFLTPFQGVHPLDGGEIKHYDTI